MHFAIYLISHFLPSGKMAEQAVAKESQVGHPNLKNKNDSVKHVCVILLMY